MPCYAVKLPPRRQRCLRGTGWAPTPVFVSKSVFGEGMFLSVYAGVCACLRSRMLAAVSLSVCACVRACDFASVRVSVGVCVCASLCVFFFVCVLCEFVWDVLRNRARVIPAMSHVLTYVLHRVSCYAPNNP